ncbi:MAG: hypothetical protein ACI96M_002878 [Candidatus Azotimanducaceae bacterium]|jgi:hypothetical protein
MNKRQTTGGSETLVVALLTSSACVLLLLSTILAIRNCAAQQESPPSEIAQHESSDGNEQSPPTVDTQDTGNDASSSGEPDAQSSTTLSETPPGTQNEEPTLAEDRSRPIENSNSRRQKKNQLVKDLSSISAPANFDETLAESDPFAVYRSIRDNCEFIVSILLPLARYTDASGEFSDMIDLLSLENSARLELGLDDNYCSYRIAMALHTIAASSTIVAESRAPPSKRAALKKIRLQLSNLPTGQERKNLACVRIGLLAWDETIQGLTAAQGGLVRFSASIPTEEGGVLACQERMFHEYARMLEMAAEALDPKSSATAARFAGIRTAAQDGQKSRYLSIQSACASLAYTHKIIAENL